MERLLTVMVLCVFASFAHADEQNAIQSPQGVEICKEPLSDNCKALGDRINQSYRRILVTEGVRRQRLELAI